MFFKGLKKAILIGSILGTAGCTRELDLEPQRDYEYYVKEIILNPKVKILDSEAIENGGGLDDSTISFYNTSKYSKGDILICGTSEKTPYGLIKKVKGVYGNQLSVSNASLEEVIQEGEISLLESIDNLKGSNSTDAFTKEIDKVIYDHDSDPLTTGDQIKVEGYVSINTGIDFNAKFNKGLRSAKFKTTIDGEVFLQVIGDFKYCKAGAVNLTEIISSPIPLGVTGLVAIPKIDLNLNYDLDLNGDLIAGIKADVKISQETKYTPSTKWTTSKVVKTDLEGKDVDLDANANVRVGLEERLTLLINGISGPFISVEEYLHLDANTNRVPWWKLNGGANVNVGINPGVLGFIIPEYKEQIFEFEKLLLQSGSDQKPVASLEVNPKEGYSSEKIYFDASRSIPKDNIAKYIFDFGDGSFYIESPFNNDGLFDGKTSHIYKKSGRYRASVEIEDVINRKDKSGIEILIKENTPPIANFHFTPDNGNTRTVFTFDATSSSDFESFLSDIHARWDFDGDGNWDTYFSPNKIVKHQFSNPGIYKTILEVCDPDSLRSSMTKEIIVEEAPYEIFVDPRDNQEYKTIKIGDQTWFAENLNYYTPEGSSYYENDSIANNQYGRLYTWHKGKFSCPEGWHMPSYEEWCTLMKYYEELYPCLTVRGLAGEGILEGLKRDGFLNYFPGYFDSETFAFTSKGQVSSFWISNVYVGHGYIYRLLNKDQESVFHDFTSPDNRFSVRPIKDN